MSVKQVLQQTVDLLPDSVTVEDAFERLYRAFKLKQVHEKGSDPLRLIGRLKPRDGRHVSLEEMNEVIRRRGAGT